MKKFITRQAACIRGVLSGFDRIRFRGTLRQLAHGEGLSSLLAYLGVWLKDFPAFAQQKTEQLRAGVRQLAEAAECPVQYLASSQTNKEELVQSLLRGKPAEPGGVVAVLSTLEACNTFALRRVRERKIIEAQPVKGKCLHYYIYLMDPKFGLTHVRLQTWFPFNTHILLNGREWLARQMDAVGLKYLRADNCFPWIEEFACAQRLASRQLFTDWPTELNRLLHRASPAFKELLPSVTLEPYWSAEQSEWATDVAFRKAQDLAAIYPRLVRHAMLDIHSADVLRFLGYRAFLRGKIHPAFKQEVTSDVAARPEGVRIKHRVGGNAIKMYDKQGTVLRVETTINDAHDLRVRRPKEGNPRGATTYRPLRKSVADCVAGLNFAIRPTIVISTRWPPLIARSR